MRYARRTAAGPDMREQITCGHYNAYNTVHGLLNNSKSILTAPENLGLVKSFYFEQDNKAKHPARAGK